MRIDCPYCGPRPELEFAYGGQAHVARPADPSKASDQDWLEFLYLRENTRGLTAGSRMTYSNAANLALNQTLVRSINTSLIALLRSPETVVSATTCAA